MSFISGTDASPLKKWDTWPFPESSTLPFHQTWSIKQPWHLILWDVFGQWYTSRELPYKYVFFKDKKKRVYRGNTLIIIHLGCDTAHALGSWCSLEKVWAVLMWIAKNMHYEMWPMWWIGTAAHLLSDKCHSFYLFKRERDVMLQYDVSYTLSIARKLITDCFDNQ